MKRVISAALSLLLIGLFVSAFIGCGADIKAENEKLKAENTSLKADNDKLRLDVQKLKEDAQKMGADKDATIASLTTEKEALKKQVDDLNAKMTKKKK